MLKQGGQTVKLEIDSALANTSLVAMAVRGLCTMTTLSPVEVNRIELCVVEIVNNAILHAYNNEKGHTVAVDVDLQQSWFQITVSDWGNCLDEDKLDDDQRFEIDADNPASWLCNGRGLSIVQNLMDDVSYQTIGDKNSFIMGKQIRG